MQRLHQSILIERDPKEVFGLIASPERYREFMGGITKWDPRSPEPYGAGSRFRVLMKVGSIEAGGILAVTEWSEPSTITWRSESGIEQTGGWELEPVSAGTRLHLRVEFHLPGGPPAWLVERITGRVVSRNMWASLMAARRLLEHEF